MSDLAGAEKRRFERLLVMGDGYVLNFSNRTFGEFVLDSTGRDIFDDKYAYASGSKANRLREFWSEEANHIVGKLLADLVDYACEVGTPTDQGPLVEECRKIAARLARSGPVPDADALTALSTEKDFEPVSREIRDAIDKNRPETGLDRLHTFIVKYVRALCKEHGIATAPEKPLHSVFGEYVKCLRETGEIQSEMAERILKSSISVLEAFNRVRNDQSLAHDNPILGYDEALLIFNNIATLVRFIRGIEARRRQRERQRPATNTEALDKEILF